MKFPKICKPKKVFPQMNMAKTRIKALPFHRSYPPRWGRQNFRSTKVKEKLFLPPNNWCALWQECVICSSRRTAKKKLMFAFSLRSRNARKKENVPFLFGFDVALMPGTFLIPLQGHFSMCPEAVAKSKNAVQEICSALQAQWYLLRNLIKYFKHCSNIPD